MGSRARWLIILVRAHAPSIPSGSTPGERSEAEGSSIRGDLIRIVSRDISSRAESVYGRIRSAEARFGFHRRAEMRSPRGVTSRRAIALLRARNLELIVVVEEIPPPPPKIVIVRVSRKEKRKKIKPNASIALRQAGR